MQSDILNQNGDYFFHPLKQLSCRTEVHSLLDKGKKMVITPSTYQNPQLFMGTQLSASVKLIFIKVTQE